MYIQLKKIGTKRVFNLNHNDFERNGVGTIALKFKENEIDKLIKENKDNTTASIFDKSATNMFPDGETFQVRHINKGIQTSNMARFEHSVTYYPTDYVLHDYLAREGRLDSTTSENKAFYDNLGVKHAEEKQTCCGGRRMRLKVFYFNVKEV